MTKNKTKDYRTFAFPNRLTSLETFFYYLKEFGVIPSQIDSNLVEKIFTAASKDFLDGYLPVSYLASIAAHFAYKMVEEYELTPGLYDIMCEAAEMDYYHTEEKIKKLLAIYVESPQKLADFYRAGKVHEILGE